MIEKELKKVINNEYLINITKIEKNEESTVGNVYIVYSKDKKYVLKIYDNLNHIKSMISFHNDLSNNFNIPKVIKNKNKKGYVKISNSKYIVLYSFLDGIQIGKLSKLSDDLIKNIALELRKLHELTNDTNKYDLKEVPFCENYSIKRKSLLHFDLTKGNIFYNEEENKIGFIDFDDAKYGPSVCDVALLIALLFFSKTKGVDKNSSNLFIDTYYGNNIELKIEETRYIKDIAINWVDYVLNGNEFDTSLKESFEVKKKLIEENIFIINLVKFKYCINKDLYKMYQDIPYKEIGSTNEIKGISYSQFLEVCKKYIEEETKINKNLNTTTSRYILYVNNLPVGEVGIRTTINEFWENKGSQMYYKIRSSERRKGYGNIILNLALKEAKKLGFKSIRVNCDNNNIASKKIILKNAGKEDINNYKTNEGYSTSYLISIEENII